MKQNVRLCRRSSKSSKAISQWSGSSGPYQDRIFINSGPRSIADFEPIVTRRKRVKEMYKGGLTDLTEIGTRVKALCK